MDFATTDGWHRADIHAAVRKAGTNLARIGESIGLRRQTMYWALFSKPNPKANMAIANVIGVPVHLLWPQWYDVDGKIISTRPIPKPARDLTARRFQPSRPRNLAA
ncbi:helix-turn-helix domain-containing protein [Methylocystis sp. WRRC1]|uniref:helix-turn-helix domain-containing protein n=1 Tax=unclassified Methylocystis TaxID=2625913 RepID=UPI0001F8683C|nr:MULTISPECIES: helix-turn-helix domain-containing protein [unclassified Methylocystis]MCC3246186.1 helix-turn-helix domain-containing protein [Methylocystis sp. WRRC1]